MVRFTTYHPSLQLIILSFVITIKPKQPIMRIFLFLFFILISTTSQASELTAAQLHKYCQETEKGFLGQKFDAAKSEICRGYMMGFADSMIITDTVKGTPNFCVPPSIKKSQNTLLLKSWVKANKKIANTTTAAVALFAAYNKAFPCK